MKYYFYCENGSVVFYSTDQNKDAGSFSELEVDISKEQEKELANGYTPCMKGDSIVMEKSRSLVEEEDRKNKESLKQKLLDVSKDPNVKLQEVIDLILQVI